MAPVTRLAQAELALHALVWTPDPSHNGAANDRDGADVSRLLDEFAGAVGETATGLAAALRTLRRPGAIPDCDRFTHTCRMSSPTARSG